MMLDGDVQAERESLFSQDFLDSQLQKFQDLPVHKQVGSRTLCSRDSGSIRGLKIAIKLHQMSFCSIRSVLHAVCCSKAHTLLVRRSASMPFQLDLAAQICIFYYRDVGDTFAWLRCRCIALLQADVYLNPGTNRLVSGPTGKNRCLHLWLSDGFFCLAVCSGGNSGTSTHLCSTMAAHTSREQGPAGGLCMLHTSPEVGRSTSLKAPLPLHRLLLACMHA